jgi:undecaprenyl-diphosphatase
VILTLLTLLVMGYLVLCQRRRLALVVLVASLGSLGANTLLKDSYERDRPDLVPHGAEVYTASFPSGHSMVAAATYLTLGALLARAEKRRRLKAYYLVAALTITLLVGVSRVYLGVHWPTDVLAGWTAGAGWALACWLLAGWLQRRGQVEPESNNPSALASADEAAK